MIAFKSIEEPFDRICHHLKQKQRQNYNFLVYTVYLNYWVFLNKNRDI